MFKINNTEQQKLNSCVCLMKVFWQDLCLSDY
ncbi:MAG: hypothetical protein K0R50_942 [Eubacterium sp.]|nr:hypothetical protein [Eubacterium sp.]